MLYIRQRRTNQTPFSYEIKGDMMIHPFYVELLPSGVRFATSDAENRTTVKVSYEKFNDWLKRLKTAISGDLGDVNVTEILDQSEQVLVAFFYMGQYHPGNTLEVIGRPFIAGRMPELASFIEVLEIAGMVSAFLHDYAFPILDPLEVKLEEYENQFGKWDDWHCEHCGNIIDNDYDGCLYCWQCPNCNAHHAHDGEVCDHCGFNRELD